jgi:hypothetical protein
MPAGSVTWSGISRRRGSLAENRASTIGREVLATEPRPFDLAISRPRSNGPFASWLDALNESTGRIR